MVKKVSPTEKPSLSHMSIDKISLTEALNIMIESQKESITAVKNSIPKLNEIIDKIYLHLSSFKKGRLIYVGAGTSGRIAVQDGAELYPTFGWPRDKFDFIIAGDEPAMIRSIEGAEDNVKNAKKIVFEKNISSPDVIIALSASGNTPFTYTVVKESKFLGALTISLVNNPYAKMLEYSDFDVILDTGSEVVTGSTRLKAGTAQKVCLNIISTMLMVKMGKVFDGEMINMVATNKKLIKRKQRIQSKLSNKE